MNCANHADASAVAYCRTCGKALCANCTRPVRGVIYCEECLAARMEGTVAPASAGFVPGTFPPAATQGRVPPPPPPPGSGSGPNPTVAGILAGFFPFGVGPVYTGQYAKGLAHLAVFVLLIAGANASDSGHSTALGIICGFGIAFFYVYQIIDSVRSARAIQMAQPLPDPFGLAATFGGGTKIEASKIPMGAIVLILLGICCAFFHLAERVRHGDAEILLACIKIFRQDSLTASAFRRRDDHAVVKVDAVGRAGLHGAPNQLRIGNDQTDRGQRVQPAHDCVRRGRRRNLVQHGRGKLSQGISISFPGIEDVNRWGRVTHNDQAEYKGFVMQPLSRNLAQRGNPVTGWLHFRLELLESQIFNSTLRLKVNTAHGTCSKDVNGGLAFPDPKNKGVIREANTGFLKGLGLSL